MSLGLQKNNNHISFWGTEIGRIIFWGIHIAVGAGKRNNKAYKK